MPDPEATSRIDRAGAGQTAEQPLAPMEEPQRLIPHAEAAALAFLALLAVGAVLLVAVKLHHTRLGAGADPVEILTSVVILSLALLRTPIHLGDLTFTLLPLGALAAIAVVVRWACRSTLPSLKLRSAVWVGPIFGLIAVGAALAFRHRFDPDPIYAGAPSAFLLGTFWTALFVAWASATRDRSTIGLVRDLMDRLRVKRRETWEVVVTATIMLGVTSALATAAGLVWIIVSLLRGGGPERLDLGGLIAATVYVVAFAPNLVIVAAALSLGAPLEIGAALTVRGRVRGQLQELSILSGDGSALALLMVAVPVAACCAAGYWVSRNSKGSVLRVLGAASGLFAGTLALLSWLAHARLGAQLASARGFGVVAPDVPSVIVMALLWAFVGSILGWALGRRAV
jgi:hypothetical protein